MDKPDACPVCGRGDVELYTFYCCEEHTIGPTLEHNGKTWHWSCTDCSLENHYDHFPEKRKPTKEQCVFRSIKRFWKYGAAKLNSLFDERADPKVLLEQAITAAQDQHRRLRDQAANVIANQKQTEMRLTRAIALLDKTNAQVRQALQMADDTVDVEAKNAYINIAEVLAQELITRESEVEELKKLALNTAEASDQAKAAVQQNAESLQKRLTERSRLLSQLDQANMQVQVNEAMASLTESAGRDVPTFDEVRDKIESRYAKAKGMTELVSESVDNRMLEVEQAAANQEAAARLDQIRAQLGIETQSQTQEG